MERLRSISGRMCAPRNRAVSSHDSDHAHAHDALGLWYQTGPEVLGRSMSRALAYFHAATRLAPDPTGFWMGLGRCAMAARQWELAERAFQHAVPLPAQTVAIGAVSLRPPPGYYGGIRNRTSAR